MHAGQPVPGRDVGEVARVEITVCWYAECVAFAAMQI